MSITLFPGVELSTSLSQHYTTSFLKRSCSVDVLGDTIYAKKLGNDKTEYALDFWSDELETIRKIKDRDGVSIDKIVYDATEVKA